MSNIEVSNQSLQAPRPRGYEPALERKLVGKSLETEAAAKLKNSIHELASTAAASNIASIEQLDRSSREVKEALKSLNQAMARVPTNLELSVDEASKRFVIKVTDSTTGEVILNFPGDAVLRVAANIDAMQGVLFDERF